MGISQDRLAKKIDVPAQHISEIVAGKKAIRDQIYVWHLLTRVKS